MDFVYHVELDVGLDWVILRPSLLLDGRGTGGISLGPAEFHGQITREDVAETVVALLEEPRITRQILELTTGSTPIEEAVRANVRWPLPERQRRSTTTHEGLH